MPEVFLPHRTPSALRAIWARLAIALGAIGFVALVTYLDRDGFVDNQGGQIGLLESFYYSTVSVTTTGYGDIVPATDRARLITTLLEDLLLVGKGLDLAERVIGLDEAGPREAIEEARPVLGVMRGETLLSFDDPEAESLRAGDRLVVAENRPS